MLRSGVGLGRSRRRLGRALRRRHNWTELAKFCAVGASGYVVNLAVYSALVRGAGLPYLAAAVGSFAVAVVSNYVCNRLWTFRHRRGGVGAQAARFLVVSLSALALNLVFLQALVALGSGEILAQAVAVVLVTPISFLGNRLWSFRRSAAPPSPAARERRVALGLAACAALLGAVALALAFVLPQTSARLAKPSAELIERFGPWSTIAGWDLPVPAGRQALAVTVVALALAGFGAYALALRLCWNRAATRGRLAAVAGVSLALFGVGAFALPTVNTDVFEYMATGRVLAAHGENPYANAADRFPGEPAYRYTDRKYTSIPGDNKLAAWTVVDSGLAGIGGRDVVGSLFLYRGFFLLCSAISLLLIALLLRRLHPRAQLAGLVAYGWNPIVIVGGQTKVDSFMVMLLLAGALALVAAHRRLAVVSIALSALVKLITLPLLAILWLRQARLRRWRSLAIETGLIALAAAVVYSPFAGAPGLASRELDLLRSGGSSPLRTLLAVAFAALVAWLGLRRRDEDPRGLLRDWALVLLAFSVAVSNLSFSWYLLVPIAVAAVAADGRVLAAMTGVGAVSFAVDWWNNVSHGSFPLGPVSSTPRPLLYLVALLAVAAGAAVIRWRGLRVRAALPAGVGRAPALAEGEPWLVLPTFNEAENLETVMGAARATLERAAPGGYRILVVDDGSPDGTGEIADRLAGAHPEVRVLHRSEREGLGPAYLAGFAHALDHGAGFVFEMDADLSHDPADLARLLAAVRDGGADLALGSRYVPGGGVTDWGLLRRLISRGGSWYARRVLGLRVRDLTGGFKCFRRAVLEGIDLDSVQAHGYAFQVELTYRAVGAGFRVVEVPIVFRDRQLGRSKMSWRIALEAIWLAPRLRLPTLERHDAPPRPPASEPVRRPRPSGSTTVAMAAPAGASGALARPWPALGLRTTLGCAALAAMIAVSAVLATGAGSGTSFMVPSVHGVLPGWMAGVLPRLGRTISREALALALVALTIGYAVVLTLRRSLSLRVIVGAILALHVIFLLAPPLLSSDVFSYVAYGRLGALHGLSPYAHAPAAAPHDPAFGYVADLWTHTRSIYGPLFTMGSYGLASLGLTASLWGFKAVAALASLALLAAVWRAAALRGRDPVAAVAIVGLNPILLVYAVGGAHNDLPMLALTMLGVVLVLSQREGVGAASIVAAAAVKASAVLVAPFLLLGAARRRTALLGGLGAGVGVTALALAVFGLTAFGFVSVLLQSDLVTRDSILSDLRALVGPVPGLRPLAGAALAVMVAGLMWRVWRGMDWVAASGWALLALVCATPALFGWYTIWPLPFAVVSGDRRLLAATLFVQALLVAHLLPDVLS
jgi:dolichol-phosphate mannosyltransferase